MRELIAALERVLGTPDQHINVLMDVSVLKQTKAVAEKALAVLERPNEASLPPEEVAHLKNTLGVGDTILFRGNPNFKIVGINKRAIIRPVAIRSTTDDLDRGLIHWEDIQAIVDLKEPRPVEGNSQRDKIARTALQMGITGRTQRGMSKDEIDEMKKQDWWDGFKTPVVGK